MTPNARINVICLSTAYYPRISNSKILICHSCKNSVWATVGTMKTISQLSKPRILCVSCAKMLKPNMLLDSPSLAQIQDFINADLLDEVFTEDRLKRISELNLDIYHTRMN